MMFPLHLLKPPPFVRRGGVEQQRPVIVLRGELDLSYDDVFEVVHGVFLSDAGRNETYPGMRLPTHSHRCPGTPCTPGCI